MRLDNLLAPSGLNEAEQREGLLREILSKKDGTERLILSMVLSGRVNILKVTDRTLWGHVRTRKWLCRLSNLGLAEKHGLGDFEGNELLRGELERLLQDYGEDDRLRLMQQLRMIGWPPADPMAKASKEEFAFFCRHAMDAVTEVLRIHARFGDLALHIGERALRRQPLNKSAIMELEDWSLDDRLLAQRVMRLLRSKAKVFEYQAGSYRIVPRRRLAFPLAIRMIGGKTAQTWYKLVEILP